MALCWSSLEGTGAVFCKQGFIRHLKGLPHRAAPREEHSAAFIPLSMWIARLLNLISPRGK